MPPKKLRLARSSFPAALRGKRFVSTHFSLSVAAATPNSGGVAVIVSKKVARTSVARHLLKRRILSIVKDQWMPGRALIVYAKAESPTLPFSLLKSELTELLSKL